jgi:hypothetical protein
MYKIGDKVKFKGDKRGDAAKVGVVVHPRPFPGSSQICVEVDGHKTYPAETMIERVYDIPVAKANRHASAFVTATFGLPQWAAQFGAKKKVDPVVEAVKADLTRRSEVGIKKYGVTLDRTDLNLRDFLQHAYEESLDTCNYLKRCIMEIDGKFKDKN